MAQLGIMTTEFEGTSLDAVLETVARQGVSTVQLQLGSALPDIPLDDALLRGLDVLGSRLTEDLANTVRACLASRGLEAAAVDGTYNMIHPDRKRRFRNLDHLQALIGLASRFGTGIVTLCTGSRNDVMWFRDPANQEPAAWRDLLEQLRVAAEVAEAEGVTLAFEPEHSNVVDSARAARRLIDEIGSPAVKVLFDPANIFHTGDLARMTDHLHDAFATLGSDIALAHAKDLDHDGAAGGRAAGRGVLDYPLWLSLLRQSGYDGAIILHQLQELDGPRVGEALDFVRRSAPAGYLPA